MKKFIFLFILSLCVSGVSAQLTLQQDTVRKKIIPDFFETVGHNILTNNTASVYDFEWVRNEVTLQPEWTTLVCDCVQCYFASVSTEQFRIQIDSVCPLDVHLKPNGNFRGFGLVELVVTDLNDPNHIINAIYIFDSELVGTRQLDVSEFKVFPNPSKGMFNVTNDDDKIKTIEVHSAAGMLMKRVEVGEREILDIMDLPQGSYILNLIGKDSKPLGTKLISKI